MADKTKALHKRKRYLLIGICLLAAVISLFLIRCGGSTKSPPVLTVETPQKISLAEGNVFSLDVTISDLGDTLYPAMSMSIGFDPSRLEFLGIQEGNVFVYHEDLTSGIAQKLPVWSCNPKVCNDTGLINVMYLDMTGGKSAFSRELLAQEDNVVLRLQFRLRGSVRPGDVLDLIWEDAVFAASEEAHSLAMTADTLKTRNGKIVVGE